jgi:hypothetical protein
MGYSGTGYSGMRNLLFGAALFAVNLLFGELGRVDRQFDLFAILDLATLGRKNRDMGRAEWRYVASIVTSHSSHYRLTN